MGLLDVMGAARDVCAGVTGIETAYRSHPGRLVESAKLPATICQAGPGTIDWPPSQDIREHTFTISILYSRNGNLLDEEEAAVELAETVIEAFKSQTQHDPALHIYVMRPTEMGAPFAFSFDQTPYTVVNLTMYAKTKVAASFS